MIAKAGHKSMHPEGAGAPRNTQSWLVTFNDMITLLMVFFVLLFAMSGMDSKRFDRAKNALQSALGVLNGGQHALDGIVSSRNNTLSPPVETAAEESAAADQGKSLKGTAGIQAEYTPKGIHLTLDDKLLFASGSAHLSEGGAALLDKVARVIKPLRRRIRVEGHTDNRPIATPLYPSNWELSTARAISVVKYMIDRAGIAPQSLSAAGYGDSRPLEKNDSQAHMARNRRVEIILEPVLEENHTNSN
jgi:chemotaxis protein MotB